MLLSACILQTCVAEGHETLMCISPRFPSPFQANNRNRMMKRSRAEEVLLNYTLVLDGAPGPNVSTESLALFLRPDPVFLELAERDSVHVPGKIISISVSISFIIV